MSMARRRRQAPDNPPNHRMHRAEPVGWIKRSGSTATPNGGTAALVPPYIILLLRNMQ